jgi:hypothetical protein
MSEDSIFREVDEELRSERMRNLWRRYGPYLIGGAIGVVLLVAVNEGWQWWQNTNAARSSDQFFVALDLADQGDFAAAQEQLNTVIAEGAGGYPMLARFEQAAILATEGKAAEAVAAYDALASADTPRRLREIALVLAARLLVDSGDVTAVQSRIGGLIDPGNPLSGIAREALGLVQYRAGNLAEARATFEEIVADASASQELVGRARVYVDQLIAEGAADGTSDTE